MNARISKTLIAGCVAALFSASGWSEGSGAAAGKSATPQTTERGAQSGTSQTTGQGGQAGMSATGAQAPVTAVIIAVPVHALTPAQLNDMEVVGAGGEHIGDVDQVVRRDGKTHIVVGAGGFLGMNERDIVLPLEQLQVTADNKLQLQNATKEALMAQPAYDEKSYTRAEPPDKPINSIYAMTPDQLNEMEVVGPLGEHIGDVDAVVRRDDKIHVVVGAGGFLGVGERDIALPLEQLQVTEENKLQLQDVTKEALLAQPKYEERTYVKLEPGNQPISDFAAFEPTADQPAGTPGAGGSSPASGKDQGAASKSGDEAAQPGGSR